MCLCASSYSAEIEIAFSVVLFGNIIIALFLIHNYRRQGPPSCEQTCSLFAQSLCSHRTVRTTNSANKPRSSNSTEMTVSTSTTESSCESNLLIFFNFHFSQIVHYVIIQSCIHKKNKQRPVMSDRFQVEYESVGSNCPTFFEYYHRYFERNIFLPLSKFVYKI